MNHVAASTQVSPVQLAMLAGSISHIARYLDSGCPRAAQLTELLLDRLGEAESLPPELMEACRQLQDVVWPSGRAVA